MKPSRFVLGRRYLPPLILALSLVLLAIPAVGAGDDGTDPVATAALSDVPGVLDTSSSVAATSDGDSALVAHSASVSVDVPTDPSAGVTVDPAAGAAVNVGVPNADQAGDAVAVAAGVIVYPDAGTSAAVAVQVVPGDDPAPVVDPAPASSDPAPAPPDGATATTTTTETTTTEATTEPDPAPEAATTTAADPTPTPAPDPAPAGSSAGGVRMMTMLQGPDAPTDYAFPLSIPDGGTIASDGDGGYDILDAAGVKTLHIAAPWARDADQAAVPVSYSLDGTTLTMHIDTTGASFPIVADPAIVAAGVIVPPPASTGAPKAAAPQPAKPAEKPELQCTGAASSGSVSTSCSLDVGLFSWGHGSDYESGTVIVKCKNCGTDQLSRLQHFYGSMASWKVDAKCGSNCSEGASRQIGTGQWVTTSSVVIKHTTCPTLVGRSIVLRPCDIRTVVTTTEWKVTYHPTCALNVLGASITRLSSDSYLVSAAFRLTCPDGGGSGSGSIESSDFRTAVLGFSA